MSLEWIYKDWEVVGNPRIQARGYGACRRWPASVMQQTWKFIVWLPRVRLLHSNKSIWPACFACNCMLTVNSNDANAYGLADTMNMSAAIVMSEPVSMVTNANELPKLLTHGPLQSRRWIIAYLVWTARC